jgi:hypothetical protein
LRKSQSLGREEETAVQKIIGCNDRPSSIIEAVFMLHRLQTGHLVLNSIRSLVLMINIHSIGQLPQWSQLPERINDMCWNMKQTWHWSDFSIIFAQLLSCNVHREVYIFIPIYLLHSQYSHNTVHMVQHVIVHRNDMMQSNCLRFRHPQGQVSEQPQIFSDVLDDSPFIQCCAERPAFSVYRFLSHSWGIPVIGRFA